MGRDCLHHLAADEAVTLKLAQAHGQHALGHRRHRAAQLAKAHRSVVNQAIHDLWFPLGADDFHHLFYQRDPVYSLLVHVWFPVLKMCLLAESVLTVFVGGKGVRDKENDDDVTDHPLCRPMG